MSGIFDANVNLNISFEKYDQSLLERGRRRLLQQFRSAVVIDQLIQAMSTETQQLYDAITLVLKERTLAEAEGVQLDVIGRLVGQERINIDGALKRWFTPDDLSLTQDNTAPWMEGASLYETTVVNDIEYRTLIFAKIFKNHVQGASIPELRYFIFILTGEDVSFNTAAPLDANLVVRSDIKPNSLSLILTILPDGNKVQNKYLIPLAATTRIVGVQWIPIVENTGQAFTPDTIYNVDVAGCSVITPI